MRNWLGVAVLLAGAVLAGADVQIFFTGPGDYSVWGVDWVHCYPPYAPANLLAPSGLRHRDVAEDGYLARFENYPAAVNPVAVINQDKFAYIWIKFDANHSLPQNLAKLQGLNLSLYRVGDPAQTPIQMGVNGNEIAWYVQDDTDPEHGIWGKKRWDGELGPGGVNFKQNPQVLVAATSEGIKNQAGNYIEDLYKGGTQASAGGRMALLGAVKLGAAGTYTFELGSLGIRFNAGGTPEVHFGELVVPEPSTMLLLGVAGLLIRRR